MAAQWVCDTVSIIKLRITVMQVITVFLGYFLSGKDPFNRVVLMWLFLGTLLVASGVAMLNHYLEREVDKKMQRTKQRPLPTGRMNPNGVFIVGGLLSIVGILVILVYVNALTGFISLMTAVLYSLIYTPLKRVTWFNTVVGAIPGALPPLGGWAAAMGQLDWGGWLLFFLLFAWQHPHFYAIAWLYKEEYQSAGFQMLPSVDKTGKSMRWQIIFFISMMILVTINLYVIHVIGMVGCVIGVVLGLYYMMMGLRMGTTPTTKTAKQLLKASIVYLIAFVILTCLEQRVVTLLHL